MEGTFSQADMVIGRGEPPVQLFGENLFDRETAVHGSFPT